MNPIAKHYTPHPQAERRAQELPTPSVERDEATGTVIVSGYAALYNTPADLGGHYTEIIRPGAFDNMIQKSDVRALFNHDPNHLLARSRYGAGTLQLEADDRGLKYSFACPKTRADIVEMIERGDLSQCSFQFTIEEHVWTSTDDKETREIFRFDEVFDITLATYPVYQDTTVALEYRSKMLADTGSDAADEIADMLSIDADMRERELELHTYD